MGKKIKKGRTGHKEKKVVIPSVKTASENSIPSTQTVDDGVSIVKERKTCTHIDKGVDLAKVSPKIGSSEPIRCADCRESASDRRAGKAKGKHGKKRGGGSSDLMSESKAIWVCLQCGHFSCGGIGFPTTPQSHAVRHAKQTRHPLAVQFENPNLQWCFPCNSLIPREKSEENGDEKRILSDIVKIIKGQSSKGGSVEVEDVLFANGSLTSGIKSDESILGNIDGRVGYVVRGLVNLGNTCFFNSIIQNLLAMGKMRDYFSEIEGSFWPLTVSLKKLYDETLGGSRNVINPRSVFGCVCAKAPQFRGYQQHDSHELLRCLLDGLSAEESKSRKETKHSPEDGISRSPYPNSVDAIFGGQLSSTVCCLECGHSSTVLEPFLDLSLPVPTKKPLSKKAKPLTQSKKSKMPPKKSGRIRSKVNRDVESIPAQSVSNSPISGESSCQEQSSLPVAETMVASSGVSTSLDILANQESRNEQFLENVTKEKVGSLEDLTWWDYLEPGIVSNYQDMTYQMNDESVIQYSGNENAAQNDVLLCNNFDGNSEACSLNLEKTTALDNHDMASQVNDESVIRSSGNEDAAQNLQNYPGSSSRTCSGNSCEDELPILVQDSEVLLLPYKEESSTHGEIIRDEGEISSSSALCEQDSMEFDGFGGLFNEPVEAESSKTNPLSNDDNSQKNQVRNSSESDPDEVDNTNSQVSIESCLGFFTKTELLTNEHGWHCENCSKALRAQKMKSRKRERKSMSKNKIYDGLTLSNAEIDAKENGFLRTTQLEEEKGEIKDGPPELSMSTSSYKTCSEASFIDQANDACSANGHIDGGSKVDIVQNTAFRFTEECESEESGNEEMDSESVKVKRDANKRILINGAPLILTVHLKRFSQDPRGRLSKLNGHVDFRDTIDLGPYMDIRCEDRGTYKYRLVGVVEHIGTMRGGHYVAYVRGDAKRTEKTEKEIGDFVWYHASDAHVREVSLEKVLRCEAYILFYEKF